jgi:hypothetical protein
MEGTVLLQLIVFYVTVNNIALQTKRNNQTLTIYIYRNTVIGKLNELLNIFHNTLVDKIVDNKHNRTA